LTELPVPGQARVFDLVVDDRTVWASTAGGVVGFQWDREHLRAANAVLIERIGDRTLGEARGLAVGRDGQIWVGTDGSGVVRMEVAPDGRPILVERFGVDDGLPPSLVCRAVLIHRGELLVGCDAGLFRFDDDERFSAVDGVNSALEDPYVVALADGGDGRLFVAHPFGVVEAIDDRIVRRFDQSSGLVGAMTTAENGLLFEDGRLWIGMVGGVTSVDVDQPVAPSTPPEVVLFDARTEDGRSIEPGEDLPWPRRTVFFVYRSPTYVAEQRTLFSERLVGLEDEWSEPHRRPERRYTNLSPGPYHLMVRAIAADGSIGPETAVVDFTVVPPWWQTVLARVVGVVALAALGWLASAWRIRAIRRSNQELEELVRQRTLALEQANHELAALARLDSLTGLANRRVFAERLGQEWLRAARRHEELAVILVDVDHFKPYNDAVGHPAGDGCLRRVATAIGACATRPQDLAARYGGEEFALLLPATDLAGARKVAERCRRQVEDLRIPHPASSVASVVTCSLGVAVAVADDEVDPADVVGIADAALYRAKAAGRNRVE
jgi:diguanylate cyclase (GGDEF)-like protein